MGKNAMGQYPSLYLFFMIIFILWEVLNHQFIQKLKLVVEGKFNYISPTQEVLV